MNKRAELEKRAVLYVACRGLLRVKQAVAPRTYDIGAESSGGFFKDLWTDIKTLGKDAFNDAVAANTYDPEKEKLAKQYNRGQLQQAFKRLQSGDTTTGFDYRNSYIDGRQIDSAQIDEDKYNEAANNSSSGEGETTTSNNNTTQPNITIQLPEGYGGGAQQAQGGAQQAQGYGYQQPYYPPYQQQPTLQDRMNQYTQYQQRTA